MRLVALPPRKQHQAEPLSLGYSRFVILSGPRTGSNLLAQALGSNPAVMCFRELFNVTHDFVQFDVDEYNNFDREEFEERQRDPVAFLDSRIFCPRPSNVHAVGFKFHYGQVWGFPGLLDRLADDRDLRVLHLQRRNTLRALASLKLAQRSGAFMAETKGRPPLARVAFAGRHPLRVARRLQRSLLRPSANVFISPAELATFIVKTNQTALHYDKVFSRHRMLCIEYEDLSQNSAAVTAQAARFVGVRPKPPIITLRRQHPEPLCELIENYDELRSAFQNSPHEALFVD